METVTPGRSAGSCWTTASRLAPTLQTRARTPNRPTSICGWRARTGGVRSNVEFSIQEFRIGSDGVARDASRVIAPWRHDWLSGLTASADGKRIAFSSAASERRVYVSGFDARSGLNVITS